MTSFAKTMGRVLGAVIVASVEAQAQNQSRLQAQTAEQREVDKWENRRLEAHAAIQRAESRFKTGRTWQDSSVINKAIDLRADADKHCRNRSDAFMTYTEERIQRFEKYGH